MEASWVTPGLRWSASYFKLAWRTGHIRGCGEERMKRVLWPQGFEECRKPTHNHLRITASSTGAYWQGYRGSRCHCVTHLPSKTLFHTCLPVPMPGMGSQQRGAQQWGSAHRMDQQGKPESSQYPAAVLMPSILHRHHSLRWTSCLDSSFLQEFHSWWRQDWMKVHCGLQPEHSTPSLSCHVMVRPKWSLLPYKDWASQKVCDYFPRESIKP